ncbi:hypothetical protein KUTeg_004720 [Tegillarca granosa]|uniref:Allantoate amidinohydrolase n=1 Tax=Tegillarca granosa TaxID=220873 RepID=A0ABQ9FJJ7_TEGGR|nr:hypothetical protein KUTeg_004720 [Tegillarca granosa]
MADLPAQQLQTFPKFTELNDLVAEKVGGEICFSTDDWFAVAENLLKANDAEFKAGVFTEYGKWMDGWETRRKRKPGHDWCIIQLALPKRKSYMGTAATYKEFTEIAPLKSENWEEIVPRSALQPGYKTSCHNFFEIKSGKRWTHLRLNMYPDGGIARFRVYGRAAPDWSKISSDQLIDLVAMENGGICIGYSNVHFGHARNLIQPGRSETMADGWETARKIEIDTNHFKGNYPDSCRIEGIYHLYFYKHTH